MDFTKLLTDAATVSPIAAILLYFLRTVWLDMRKDRQDSLAMMKEHSSGMLQMQEKSITAQNNAADANRQLAGAIGDLKDHLSDKLDEVKSQLPKNGQIRRVGAPGEYPKKTA